MTERSTLQAFGLLGALVALGGCGGRADLGGASPRDAGPEATMRDGPGDITAGDVGEYDARPLVSSEDAPAEVTPPDAAADSGRRDARARDAGFEAALDATSDDARPDAQRRIEASADGADDALSVDGAPSSCDDNLKDGLETDIDCGGPVCPPCGVGQGCKQSSDCGTSPGCDPVAGCACSAETGTCVYDHCDDYERDDGETDVDCGGGTCPGCAQGRACVVDSDCSTTLPGCDPENGGCACDALTMTCVYNHCFDHKLDGQETAIDCGGSACTPCALGQACLIDEDCATNSCDGISLVCVASQCSDHRQDGAETDVDCGGPVCSACANGQTCQTNFDCAAGVCTPEGLVHVCM